MLGGGKRACVSGAPGFCLLRGLFPPRCQPCASAPPRIRRPQPRLTMKTSLKVLSLPVLSLSKGSNGRLLPLVALLTLGAAPALLAADGSAANRREFQLGADSIKLYDPRPATPLPDAKPGATAPGTSSPPAGTAAALVIPPILVTPATPLPPPPVSDRRSFSSPDGGLVLNPKAVQIGSGNAPAPATAPSSRREFKVGSP